PRPLFLTIRRSQSRPIPSTVRFDLMCRQIELQSPVWIFIQEKTHLGRRDCVLPRFFKESDDLRALYAGKSLEKLLDRVREAKMRPRFPDCAIASIFIVPTSNFSRVTTGTSPTFALSMICSASAIVWSSEQYALFVSMYVCPGVVLGSCPKPPTSRFILFADTVPNNLPR